jgi:N-acetylneuraminic acid mutarotase
MMAGMTSAAPVATVPQQAQTCSWDQFGSSAQARFHPAAAMDVVSNTMYIYGGLTQTGEAVNTVSTIDFSPMGLNNAVHRPLTIGSAQQRYGAAAAYRSNGHEVYFIGGANDTDHEGTNGVQVLDVDSNTWNSNFSASGQLGDRVFAAAAYDPDHDAIIVIGGADRCNAIDPDPMNPDDECDAANNSVVALTFNSSGAGSWTPISGGPRNLIGATMVYDSVAKRMLVFGGATSADSQGATTIMQLDLSKPTLAEASWSNLSTSGSVTGRFFHSAAFDAANNRMIVYGGVRQNAFSSTENTLNNTFALDLTKTPPQWMQLSGATDSSHIVGSVMAYDPKNAVAVLAMGRRQFSTTGNQNTTNASKALECEAPQVPTETPTGQMPGPTDTPGGQPTVEQPTPTLVVPTTLKLCDFITNRVPNAAINAAMAAPASVGGFGQLCYPSRPPSPFNRFREYLSLRNIAKPYHPIYNGLIAKCGCP